MFSSPVFFSSHPSFFSHVCLLSPYALQRPPHPADYQLVNRPSLACHSHEIPEHAFPWNLGTATREAVAGQRVFLSFESAVSSFLPTPFRAQVPTEMHSFPKSHTQLLVVAPQPLLQEMFSQVVTQPGQSPLLAHVLNRVFPPFHSAGLNSSFSTFLCACVVSFGRLSLPLFLGPTTHTLPIPCRCTFSAPSVALVFSVGGAPCVGDLLGS